jgi:hypothetical protein
MTAIFYPDCKATSDDKRFTLEARSPHNGTIRHRDGRKASEDEFGFKYRQHQSEFRYRLLDNTRKRSLSRLFGGDGRDRFPMPERLPDGRERARCVREGMPAEDVLRLLGSPDFVRRRMHDPGTSRWRSSEDWEYDFREEGGWVTLRVTWEERDERGVMVAYGEVVPYWVLSDERESEFLRM